MLKHWMSPESHPCQTGKSHSHTRMRLKVSFDEVTGKPYRKWPPSGAARDEATWEGYPVYLLDKVAGWAMSRAEATCLYAAWDDWSGDYDSPGPLQAIDYIEAPVTQEFSVTVPLGEDLAAKVDPSDPYSLMQHITLDLQEPDR